MSEEKKLGNLDHEINTAQREAIDYFRAGDNKMTDELNDDQVAWLGKFMGIGKGDFRNPDGMFYYFAKADNQEAVMDRAVEKGYAGFIFNIDDKGIWEVGINKGVVKSIWREGPNRFHALVNALMEAEGR